MSIIINVYYKPPTIMKFCSYKFVLGQQHCSGWMMVSTTTMLQSSYKCHHVKSCRNVSVTSSVSGFAQQMMNNCKRQIRSPNIVKSFSVYYNNIQMHISIFTFVWSWGPLFTKLTILTPVSMFPHLDNSMEAQFHTTWIGPPIFDQLL